MYAVGDVEAGAVVLVLAFSSLSVVSAVLVVPLTTASLLLLVLKPEILAFPAHPGLPLPSDEEISIFQYSHEKHLYIP